MPRKIAISWVELVLLALLVLSGMGIGVIVEQQIGTQLKKHEPRIDVFEQQESVPVRQAELSNAQSELKNVQDKLMEHRLALSKQATRIEALIAEYPALREMPHPARRPASVPAEIFKGFAEARIDADANGRLVKQLSAELTQVIKNVSDRTAALSTAQRLAAHNYDTAKDNFASNKKWQALLWAAVATVAFLLVTRLVAAAAIGGGGGRAGDGATIGGNLTVTFTMAAAVLSILLGYQVFQLVGAAVAGMVVVICLLYGLQRAGVAKSPEGEKP